jgi:hypothetical protein
MNHLVPSSYWFLLQWRKIRDERSARQTGLYQTSILALKEFESPRDHCVLSTGAGLRFQIQKEEILARLSRRRMGLSCKLSGPARPGYSGHSTEPKLPALVPIDWIIRRPAFVRAGWFFFPAVRLRLGIRPIGRSSCGVGCFHVTAPILFRARRSVAAIEVHQTIRDAPSTSPVPGWARR